jgi:hypothetical protein
VFYGTFHNVSLIFHICAICKGFQEAHVLCHSQYCFSLLPHLCYRQGGSGGSCFLPLALMFQSFNDTSAIGRGFQEAHVCCHFQYCFSHLPHLCYRQGVQKAHILCHFKYCFSHLPHLCCRLGVHETHVFATFNNVSVIYHSINVGRGWGLMCNASCNNVSVFYHTCAIGKGVRRFMFFATFNNVSVIYHTCAIGRGEVQQTHVYSHFQ